MGDYRQEARIYRDGNMWCAVPPGFRNLAIDVAGFGETKKEAITDLIRNGGDAYLKSAHFVTGGYCRRCQDWIAEDLTPEDCATADCPCKNGVNT